MIIGNPLLELFDLNTTGSKTPNEKLFENFDRGRGSQMPLSFDILFLAYVIFVFGLQNV